MKLIIINGLPATGKTYISSELSKELSLPKIAKDDIKEFLFEKLGTKDREWSKSLGKLSNDFLYELTDTMLNQGQSFMVENAFEYEFAKPRFEILIKKYNPSVFEVYCHTNSETRRQRFVERNESRERHKGHADESSYLNPDDPEPTVKYAELNVGELLKIDTTNFNDVHIKEMISNLVSC